MLIFEVENRGADTKKLIALTQFLSGRANDQSAKKEISAESFIKLAQSLGVNVTPDTLGDLIAQPPLSNMLEPYEPNSGVIRYKGNTATTTQMDVNQAEKIVSQNAKKALKRGSK